jgi:DNA processing protein
MNDPSEQIYANALNLIVQLGAVRLGHLLKHFGSFKKAWDTNRAGYVSIGFNPKLVEQIVSRKLEIDPPAEYGKLGKHGIEAVLINSSDYPETLKEISAAPPIIYARGNLSALNTTAVGVVGTRKITNYGKLATEEITAGLVNSGVTIVSGLAFGVDAQALSTAVELGGICIGVLASPLDNQSIAPKSNFQLAEKILERGCLVSEYPLEASVQVQNFPIRNRIIAGLSLGTLVVEGDTDSGALITANYSLEQNREVFAVPGSIFSNVSKGPNNLIKKGAKLVSSAQDILEELNLDLIPTPKFELNEGSNTQEQVIMENLTREPIHIDELTRQLNMPASEINATLVMLEMKGRVRNLGGAKFVKIR